MKSKLFILLSVLTATLTGCMTHPQMGNAGEKLDMSTFYLPNAAASRIVSVDSNTNAPIAAHIFIQTHTVAVKETGGFTRAGNRLNLTQSAISHQIRRLEEQVGRQLLQRTTRRLTLTEDGEEFLRHAEQILASLDALTQRFQPSPVSGVVRFGVPESFMGDRLPRLLCQFARAFPSRSLFSSQTLLWHPSLVPN